MPALAQPLARIRRSIELGGRRGRIVLYFWSANVLPRIENLVRLDPDGSVRWRASLPDSLEPDCFVDVKSAGGELLAFTWSGATMILDPVTGNRTDPGFVAVP